MPDVSDPRALRALAHPLRLALLEALSSAPTLTATQASDLFGESPANCAFHLRTLARYGFAEEAGHGPGRTRRWRRTGSRVEIPARPGDARWAAAADAFGQVWLDRYLERARQSLTRQSSWPAEWQQSLGRMQFTLHLTPAEARAVKDDIARVLQRHAGRLADPARRPAGAAATEFLVLGYLPPPPADEPGSPGE